MHNTTKKHGWNEEISKIPCMQHTQNVKERSESQPARDYPRLFLQTRASLELDLELKKIKWSLRKFKLRLTL